MGRIIGINGKIGSGKDTVGAIIQYLVACSNPILGEAVKNNGLEGYQMWDHEGLSGWKIKKFAGKLKLIASIITGIPVNNFEDQEFKKSFLGSEWDRLTSLNHGGLKRMTVRELLQKLGTEAIRDGIHTNAWVNALYADFNDTSNWIITDMRFPNEFDSVAERGGTTIRIKRTLPDQPYPTLEKLHPSETALDNHVFKYEIDNNGTLQELTEKVKQILIAERIL